jgi:hypothetical protein
LEHDGRNRIAQTSELSRSYSRWLDTIGSHFKSSKALTNFSIEAFGPHLSRAFCSSFRAPSID